MKKRDKVILSCVGAAFIGFLIVYQLGGGDILKLFWNQDAFEKSFDKWK